MCIGNKTDLELSPGPGSYTVEKFAKDNAAPKFGFGKDIKDKFYKTVRDNGPGPGFYNEKKVLGDGVPGYSIKGRRPDCRVLPGKDAPGPGNYDPSTKFCRRSAPKYRMSRASKSKIANIYGETPAPNVYRPSSTFVKSQSAAWGMGSNKRPGLSQILDTPGPGSYDPKLNNGDGPSLRGKSQVCLKESPGPGSYSPDVRGSKKKSPIFSMGTEQKKTISAKPLNYFPGPGTYVENKFRTAGPKFGFGSSKRMEIKKDNSPGPGSYKIPTKVRDLGK